MRQGAAGAVWYRSRATLHRRRGGYVTLALLIGLVTGVPPGITGGRRLWLLRAVAWQATVIAAAGVAIGVPLGIAAGRWLWVLFARQLSAFPAATVPAVPIMLAALAAIALANVVAALPGRRAARTPAATVLRAE